MNILIGNKSTLGIEFHYINKKIGYGNAKLWVGDDFIGSICDSIYFDSYLLAGLGEIYNKRTLDNIFLLKEDADLYYFFQECLELEDDELCHQAYSYRIHIGTWTDYFSVYSYRLNDEIGVLLWKLETNYDWMKDLDLVDYPQKVFTHTFRYDELKALMDEFVSILNT